MALNATDETTAIIQPSLSDFLIVVFSVVASLVVQLSMKDFFTVLSRFFIVVFMAILLINGLIRFEGTCPESQ